MQHDEDAMTEDSTLRKVLAHARAEEAGAAIGRQFHVKDAVITVGPTCTKIVGPADESFNVTSKVGYATCRKCDREIVAGMRPTSCDTCSTDEHRLGSFDSAVRLRSELAVLLAAAAAKADEWSKAAQEEWDRCRDQHANQHGRVTPDIAGPYVEYSLACSYHGKFKQQAEHLAVDASKYVAGHPIPEER